MTAMAAKMYPATSLCISRMEDLTVSRSTMSKVMARPVHPPMMISATSQVGRSLSKVVIPRLLRHAHGYGSLRVHRGLGERSASAVLDLRPNDLDRIWPVGGRRPLGMRRLRYLLAPVLVHGNSLVHRIVRLQTQYLGYRRVEVTEVGMDRRRHRLSPGLCD